MRVDSDGSYTVSWGAVATATRYQLQERINGGSWSTVYDGASRSQAETGKTDATYGYQVRACTVGGCSGWSVPQSVLVAHPPTSAPSLSVPSSDHDGSYTVSWGSVARATSYTLQERKNSGSWVTIYTGSSRSKVRSGRTDGSYGYRVRGSNAGGIGPWSATHTVNVVIYPPTPGNVYINDRGSYKVIYQYLVWDTVSGATHYDVKVGSNGVVVNVGTVTSYRVGGYPTDGIPTVVTAYVRACNASGCSAWASATGI